MTTETPKITFLPTAAPDRIFRRTQDDVSGSMPMDDALTRVAHAIASDLPYDDILNEIAVAAKRQRRQETRQQDPERPAKPE